VGRLLRLLLLVIVAIALFACDKDAQQSPAAIYENDPAAVKRGKLVFAGTCGAYCHKLDKGQGGFPYLFDCAWQHGGSDEEIFKTIRDGVPDTQMVGFGGALPDGDEDIWKIIAYIRETDQCGEN
jgi:mono/diheme cytochrome c family protein